MEPQGQHCYLDILDNDTTLTSEQRNDQYRYASAEKIRLYQIQYCNHDKLHAKSEEQLDKIQALEKQFDLVNKHPGWYCQPTPYIRVYPSFFRYQERDEGEQQILQVELIETEPRNTQHCRPPSIIIGNYSRTRANRISQQLDRNKGEATRQNP